VVFILTLILADIPYQSSAQLSIDKLDYSRVPQKKIINLIEAQTKSGIESFTDLLPKCYEEKDLRKFRKVSTSYTIRGKADKVWNEYLSIQPHQAYSGRIVGFGFLYSKGDDKILYNEDPFDKMKVGQMYFFNLKLLGGIKNLGVADEVTAIDEMKKMIRFCYLENGKCEGTQEIHVKENPEGNTVIIHDTWYKSNSRFRDRVLYPFFHKRTVNEYHHIIRDRIENEEPRLSDRL